MSLTFKSNHQTFRVGDTIKVHQKFKVGDKTQSQIFEGLVIAVKGRGLGRSFTIRKMSDGIGVEKILPVASQTITKIELKKAGNTRRAKLYYLRKKIGKLALATKSVKN